ncbi:MAG: porin [Gammaproteobacteria bacterium]|nr:porin [Gammaproteobacteria bacterium]MBU1722373.1 porin [Gammaproteobacteria bacterium]MBU2004690.1 porin [Gammaproteobacteria bacterium]
MKNLLAISIAAALVAPAAAMADTTLYGKLHATVGQWDETSTANVQTKNTRVESHNSRIGIKGSTALDNGLEATYGMEYGLTLDENTALATSRNQFVGVKGGFGEVRVGRHDTPAKLATVGLDVFADGSADMANIIAADGERVDNVVAYINKFGPVGFAAAHSTGVAEANEDNGLTPGDANTMLVNYGNGPWYAALGHTAINGTRKNTNIGVAYKAEAGHFANLVYETVKYSGVQAAGSLNGNAAVNTDGAKDTNIYVGGGYKMGNTTLKAAYGEGKRKGETAAGDNGKEKMTVVGAAYNLGKKTDVYLELKDNKNTGRTVGGTGRSKSSLVGIVTEF